jgi:hypothetical protein
MALFHIRLEFSALDCRCSFVYGISNVGFPHRWLVSLAMGKDIREHAWKQSSQLLNAAARFERVKS